ncbi:transglutaminase family protein [Paraconexibacter sp.]|uniref:transglutaminase-like domain-containing protein n=1 Tax=Paraconexibacter sp. TaxID=2949640 RepID=UPI003561CFE3
MPQPTTTPVTPADLAPTAFLDADHPDVLAFARDAVGDATDDVTKARRLFAAVRDGIRYDPFSLSTDPASYRASAVLAAGSAYCVPKSVLLSAAARAVGVPARLGLADVRNHLQSPRLAERMGTDLFVYHGYSTLFVGGAWRKASSAFNAELCARFGVEPLDFDGTSDALLHAFSGDGSRYMEYLHDHGDRQDLPLEEILDAYRRAYPVLIDG